MIGLGLRLIVAGGRSSAIVVGLTALAVAFGTALLLFALAFEPAASTRYNHSAWRDTPGQQDLATATTGLMLARTDDHWDGRKLVRMDVAALSPDAPVPPGLTRVPPAGQAFVSPALADLLVTQPPDQLGDRFGEVVDEIGPAGLMAPDELAVVVGRAPDALRADGARVVTALDGTRPIPTPTNPLIRILIVICVIGALAPVAVFVASATRLSAARREQRLAALRLAGATPGQVTRLAALEALVATIPGAFGGVALFLLLRPLVAMVPLGQATWFPDSIVPPLLPAVALLLVVQVVGVGAAVVALRRVNVSPLGVRRREGRRPLRKLRLVPLAVSFALFAFSIVQLAAMQGAGTLDTLIWLLGGSFFGIIVSIAIAGPWVTAAVGAILGRLARGPIPLLAGRRLADEPRGAFGAIGGVVMAVFIGSAYLSIAAFTAAASPGDERLGARPDVLLASVPGDGSRAAEAVRRLTALPGVQDVAEIREVAVGRGDTRQLGVVADCRALVSVLSATGLSCGPGLVHLGPGGTPFADATVQSATFLGGFSSGDTPITDVPLRVASSAVDRYAPDDLDPASRLALPALIIEPGAFSDGGAAFPTTRLAILTDGSQASVERARTVAQVVMPTSVVRTVSESANDSAALVVELGRVVSLGVIVAMLLAGASLAIAVISGLVERRTPFALLRLAGMPLGKLRAILVLEAAAPLVAVATLSAVLGVAVAQLVLHAVPTREVPPPDAGVAVLLVAATAGAIAVVLAAMPLVGRITGSEANRFE